MSFDEESTHSADEGLFGIPTDLENSELILIPVPWDVTTSYGKGTSEGPEHIREASPQIDLYNRVLKDQWRKGFHMLPVAEQWVKKNAEARKWAEQVIEATESGSETAETQKLREQVNEASAELNQWVYHTTKKYLEDDHFVGVVGGDHSCPLGAIQAYVEHYNGDLGILHIDAHADLRKAYQGFTYSHASIMYNVMQLETPPSKLVQLGIRDFARSEYEYSHDHPHISTIYDQQMRDYLFCGDSFQKVCDDLMIELPQNLYISFDIDGLDPALCPNTGTPVPGGFQYNEVQFLLHQIGRSGRNIVGFDLCEVSPDPTNPKNEWNGNVGARILFELSSWTTYEEDDGLV